MNARNLLALIVIGLLLFVMGCTAPNQASSDSDLQISASECHTKVDSTADSVKIGATLADYIMTTYPSYMDYETNVIKKGWEYTNGVVLTGFIKLYESTKNIKYLNYVKPYVDKYVLADGTIQYFMGDGVSVRDKRIQDVIQPSFLLFALYKNDATTAPQYLTAMKNTRNIFPAVQTTTSQITSLDIIQTNSLGGFFHKPTYQYQMWLDGLYMAEPFIATYAAEYADVFDPTGADKRACFDTATYQLLLIADKTMDLSSDTAAGKLPVHGWLDLAGINAYNADSANTTKLSIPAWANTTTGKSPEQWSRAMGWYSMALVDVLSTLPRHHKDYRALKEILETIAAGLAEAQDPTTGLWYQVVNKTPAVAATYSDNWLETSGSAMFVYALKKAIDNDLISSRYLKVAEKGWEGIKTKVVIDSTTGKVTVQGSVGGMSICNNYAAYIAKKSVIADDVPHAIAAVLMAASEMEYKDKRDNNHHWYR